MLYVGIDIGKNHHEAGIINAEGKRLGESMRFSNQAEGFAKLLRLIETKRQPEEGIQIAMEATGHYWLTSYAFLSGHGFDVTVINPLQSDGFRNINIRQTKTDSVDSFLIAELLRFQLYEPTRLADEEMIALRNLARFRESMVDTCANFKCQVIALLDQVFPEYEKLFSDVFGAGSKALLRTCSTPEQCLEVSTKTLATLLKKASHGYYGTSKVQEIKAAAKTSCGIKIAGDAFAFQLQLLIQQIDYTEKQVKQIDRQIADQLKKVNTVVMTIPGVGPSLGAIIVGEIGDISRFANPKKLVAFAGIDPTVKQSGAYSGDHNRLSKRGSPYLRRAIWLAAGVAARTDPVFKAFYDKKFSEGKSYGTAIGAVARKLTYTIFAVLKANKPYEIRLQIAD